MHLQKNWWMRVQQDWVVVRVWPLFLVPLYKIQDIKLTCKTIEEHSLLKYEEP